VLLTNWSLLSGLISETLLCCFI